MARQDASDLAHSLGRQAEAVCRHYLSSGRREGNYWLVGDARNTPGRSMYVRLKDTPKGPAGKWTDAATGEHGDLLDVIRESCGLIDFKDVADEARTFLSMPPAPEARQHERQNPAPHGSPEAARRLVRMSQPIHGTLVQTYLRERGITDLRGTGSLHFHPRCYYRPEEHSPTETWPAMIAAVTDLDGKEMDFGAGRSFFNNRGMVVAKREIHGEILDLVRELLDESDVPVEISWVRSLAEARTAAVGGFECVLLDLGLPDASGFEALRGVLDASPEAAVLVLTGLDD